MFFIKDEAAFRRHKTPEYMIHPELRSAIEAFSILSIAASVVIIGLFTLMVRGYPTNLATMDLTDLVLMIIFWVWTKPKMLRGKWKGYFKRDYSRHLYMNSFFGLVVLGGVFRGILIVGYYIVSSVLPYHRIPWDQNLVKFLAILWNPVYSLYAVGLFALMVFLYFYQERYIPIREFSNTMVEIMAENPRMDERFALRQLQNRRDAQLKYQKIRNVKYDGIAKPSTMPVTHHSEDQADTQMVEQEQEQKMKNELFTTIETKGSGKQKEEMVRRQSRR